MSFKRAGHGKYSTSCGHGVCCRLITASVAYRNKVNTDFFSSFALQLASSISAQYTESHPASLYCEGGKERGVHRWTHLVHYVKAVHHITLMAYTSSDSLRHEYDDTVTTRHQEKEAIVNTFLPGYNECNSTTRH